MQNSDKRLAFFHFPKLYALSLPLAFPILRGSDKTLETESCCNLSLIAPRNLHLIFEMRKLEN